MPCWCNGKHSCLMSSENQFDSGAWPCQGFPNGFGGRIQAALRLSQAVFDSPSWQACGADHLAPHASGEKGRRVEDIVVVRWRSGSALGS